MMRAQLDLYTETFNAASYAGDFLALRFGDADHRVSVTLDGSPDDIRRVLQAALAALNAPNTEVTR